MNFDLQSLAPRESYRLLTDVVVPRPIALVTSVGENGIVNAAPYSFFNLLGVSPPLVALGIGDKGEDQPKDSARNIKKSGEFVVNLVSRELAGAMNVCAVDFPAKTSEIEAAGLQIAPSTFIATPRIAGAPAALECRLHTTLQIGENRIILAQVVALYVADEFLDAAKTAVLTGEMGLIGRMGGAGGYIDTSSSAVTDASGGFEMPRLSLETWQNQRQRGAR